MHAQIFFLAAQYSGELITQDGGISAQVVMGASFTVIAFAIIAYLRHMSSTLKDIQQEIKDIREKDIRELRERQNHNETRIQLHEQRMESYQDFDAEELANSIVLKIRATGAAFNQ